jgi:hypothetical protein
MALAPVNELDIIYFTKKFGYTQEDKNGKEFFYTQTNNNIHHALVAMYWSKDQARKTTRNS